MGAITEAADKLVLAGVNFLDSSPQIPADWRERIDIRKLNISIACSCVIGQIFEEASKCNGWCYATVHLGIFGYNEYGLSGTDNPRNLGFISGNGVRAASLTAAWRRYLKNYFKAMRTINKEIAELTQTASTQPELVSV